MAVDTLGHLLALHVSPTSAQDREQVELLVAAVQEATGEAVELAYVDQGYTGGQPAADAAAYGLRLEVVKLPDVRRGFVLLPRRLARDYERLPRVAVGLHFAACLSLLVARAVATFGHVGHGLY